MHINNITNLKPEMVEHPSIKGLPSLVVSEEEAVEINALAKNVVQAQDPESKESVHGMFMLMRSIAKLLAAQSNLSRSTTMTSMAIADLNNTLVELSQEKQKQYLDQLNSIKNEDLKDNQELVGKLTLEYNDATAKGQTKQKEIDRAIKIVQTLEQALSSYQKAGFDIGSFLCNAMDRLASLIAK